MHVSLKGERYQVNARVVPSPHVTLLRPLGKLRLEIQGAVRQLPNGRSWLKDIKLFPIAVLN